MDIDELTQLVIRNLRRNVKEHWEWMAINHPEYMPEYQAERKLRDGQADEG